MIKSSQQLSTPEAMEYVDGKSEQGAKVLAFAKKFGAINPKKANEMREKLLEVNSIKINEGHIAKIIEFMPENSEEVNKIFTELSLEEDEKNKILDIVNQFK